MKNSVFVNIIKYVLTILAIINLILLFGFHYEIPTVIKDKFFNEDEQSLIKTPEEKDPINISFDTDTLNYDGTISLNLLDGVNVTDKDGNPLELTVYSTITSTEEPTTKKITYSVKDEDGNSAMEERKLILTNYYGPALSVSQPYPVIYDTELKYIPQTFADNGLLSANDGYGKNITDAIQCDYQVTNDVATEVEVSFSVTNHFDDTVTETILLPIERTRPLILLTEESVTLSKDSAFEALSYVESATNEEGEDLRGRIRLEGDVTTSTPGIYEITYTLTDRDLEKANPVTLTVTVKE